MGRKAAVIPKLREVNGYAACWVKDKYVYFGKVGTPEADAAYR